MLNLKFTVRLLISIALYYTGMVRLARYLRNKSADKKNAIRILAYHDISDKPFLNLHIPPRVFYKQIKYLIKAKYNIISLVDAISLLKNNLPVPDNTVVITFDDVYKSFYTDVFPIVKKYDIPVNIFLAGDPLEKGYPLFIDALIYAFSKTACKELDLTVWNIGKYSIKSLFLKEDAMREINDFSKGLTTQKRKELLEFIFKQLRVDFQAPELRDDILKWNDILEMSRDSRIEFGAHTMFHHSLSRISCSEAHSEISGSKIILQQRLNKEIKTFAYPYGSRKDITDDVKEIVKENGFICGVTLNDGVNKHGDDLFMLNRMCVSNDIRSKLLLAFSTAVFAVQIENILHLPKRRLYEGVGEKGDEKKINILYMIDQLETGAGTERHLTSLVTRLDKSRFNCHVYFFQGKFGRIQQEMLRNGVGVRNINLSRIYSLKALIKAFQLAVAIKKSRIDIVQTFHFMSDTYGVFISKLLGVPKIISSRRDIGDLKKPRQIMLNKIMNRFIDRYIMVCNKVGERVSHDEGVSKSRMTTIYNGVDLEKFSRNGNHSFNEIRNDLRLTEDDFVIGKAAIFRPEKAYHVFFEAVKSIGPFIRNLKVILLGDGPTRRYFEDYCKRNKLEDIVKFAGYVDDVKAYVQQMDVFCLVPNSNEGFSNAILEAMALGKPVIATDVGGNAEAVIHNETGFIIPPDDPQCLADAILKLYYNPGLREAMGKAARNRTEETFSVEMMIKNHEKLYKEVLSR
ncbi:MAG: glycosyltransferase [Nitrospirae bacterium]|nr:glycosyltransferase [Nitrospirota bacterium]